MPAHSCVDRYGNVINLKPPMVISEEQIMQVVATFDQTLHGWSSTSGQAQSAWNGRLVRQAHLSRQRRLVEDEEGEEDDEPTAPRSARG